jgi:hypothetical protein
MVIDGFFDTPLLLDSGDQAFIGNNANFSFELA